MYFLNHNISVVIIVKKVINIEFCNDFVMIDMFYKYNY